MMKTISIGVIGDYNPQNSTHVMTDNAIQHAAEALGTPIEAVWFRGFWLLIRSNL